MRWKTTVVLLLATVGIGAYIALYEIKQPTPEQRPRVAKRVARIPSDTVIRMTIESPQATLTLTREGTVWHFDPEGFRADPQRISRILAYTESLFANRILSDSAEQPLEPSMFGLDPAVGRLTLLTDEGETTLHFGEATAVAGYRYLQRADRPEVFIIATGLFDAINQPLETFRAQEEDAGDESDQP